MSVEMKNAWLVWLKAAGIRAVKTWAQAALAYLTACGAVGVLDLNWAAFFSVSLFATLYSVLMSLAGLPEAESPVRDSIQKEEVSDE